MFEKLKHVFSLFTQKEDAREVQENIESNIVFKGTNLWVLILAVFIASLGLNVNSTAVIIGAMLISPLMGPIMGMGFAVGINKPSMLKLSIVNYAFASIIGLITSTIYFLISPLSEAHSEILARISPTIYDVLIAFLGGCAGMLANGSKLKGNVIPGVAIATALMPPLCTAGFGLATGQFNYFFGAFYLYLINTVFIGVATFLMVKILDLPSYHFSNPKNEKQWRFIMSFVILVTLVPSIWFGYQMIKKNTFEQKANSFISSDGVFPNNFLLSKNISFENNRIELTYGGEKLSQEDFQSLIRKASKYGLGGSKIIVKQGFKFSNIPDKLESPQTSAVTQQNLNRMLILQDSISLSKKLNRDIFEELKVQSQHVSGFSFSKGRKVKDSTVEKRKTALVYTKVSLSKNTSEKIKDYLKSRLKDAETEVVFIQED